MAELRTVLELVDRGWAVLPCSRKTKRPMIPRGVHRATRDRRQAEAWVREYADANFAIACGEPSGVWVLDVDGPDGEASLHELEATHGALPPTLRVVTGRGFHLYFRMPEGIRIGNRAGLMPGLDVRGSGGYVIAPGARHSSGAVYSISGSGAAVVDAPSWLLELVARSTPETAPPPPTAPAQRAHDPRARKVLEQSVERVRGAAKGQRNNALNAAAYTCAGFGVDEAEARDALLGAALEAGLERGEARRTFESGWASGSRKVVALDPSHAERRARERDAKRAPSSAADVLREARDEAPANADTNNVKPGHDNASTPAREPPVPKTDAVAYTYKVEPGRGELQFPGRVLKDGTFVETGPLKPNLHNLVVLAHDDADISGLFGYNELAQQVVLLRRPPWTRTDHVYPSRVTHDDVVWFTIHLQTLTGSAWKVATLGEALSAIARLRTFDPLKDYLRGLRWDGRTRLDDWIRCLLGAADLPIYRAYGRRWLISAVARAFVPGVDVEGCLVLEDERQGTGKSTALRILATGARRPEQAGRQRAWHHDGRIRTDRDGVLEMEGTWIWELSELAGLSRADVEDLKSFLTRPRDLLRRPYARVVDEIERRNVFAASTNRRQYLRDDENRRWWPVATGTIALDELAKHRDQLWAEAVVAFEAGEPWYLDTPELRAQHDAHVGDRREVDPWDAIVAGYAEGRDGISTRHVFEFLGIEQKDRKRADEQRIAAALRVLGYTDRRQVTQAGVREWAYFRANG